MITGVGVSLYCINHLGGIICRPPSPGAAKFGTTTFTSAGGVKTTFNKFNGIYVMLRLIMFFFLILGMPVIPNAAGIYDNKLTNVDNQKKENIKTNKMQFLNDNLVKTSSDYEAELTSVLKKNTIKHKFENNLLSDNKFYLTDADSSQFIQVASYSEAEMDWAEIKADLKDVAARLSTFDRSATRFLDEYLSQNINTNLVFVFNIKANSQLSDELNFYEKKRLSNVAHQGDAPMKVEDYSYKLSSLYKNEPNSAYESGGEQENILSIIYLWKMYSDTIISVVSIIAILWLIIAGLIKFLIWRVRLKNILRGYGKL